MLDMSVHMYTKIILCKWKECITEKWICGRFLPVNIPSNSQDEKKTNLK